MKSKMKRSLSLASLFSSQRTRIQKTLIVLYVLAILGFSAAARASITIFPTEPRANVGQLKTFVGELAMTLDGRAYLVVSDHLVDELRGTEMDLSALNGLRVQVQGYELMYRVGPVYRTSAFNPLLDDEVKDAPTAPILVVESLSEIVE